MREKFADVDPPPTDAQLDVAFWQSVVHLAAHRTWARAPDRQTVAPRVSFTDVAKEFVRLIS